MSATTTEMVSVDRELLRSLIVEVEGVVSIVNLLAGCEEAEVVVELSRIQRKVAEAAGFVPQADEYSAWARTDDGREQDANGKAHPAFEALWQEGDRRRDEILGLTREAVAL